MIKILIVDDQKFTREALQAILETEPDFEIISKAASGIEAIGCLEQTKIDVALVDLQMPQMSGLTLTQIMAHNFRDTKVIILSSHDDEDNVNLAVESGAKGYLLKDTSPQEIIDTIGKVHKGYFQLGPGLFDKLQSYRNRQNEQIRENPTNLEQKYIQLINELEQKIMIQNETERLETYQELERQTNNLKQEFRSGLEIFQRRVSERLQNGIDVANNRLHDSIPDWKTIEMQLNHRNIEQQRYINTLFTGNKQAVKKLERKVSSLQYIMASIGIIFLFVSMLLLIR
jgi:DNA-binding NarL/FixJ family response regulator